MKLLVQPDDGVNELVKGINAAKTTIEITIFRFDHRKVESALTNAAKRGVFVHALIARVNSGGEKYLRKLEMRLLDRGITVGRTDNSLARYHSKLMIIDRQVLYLMGFNYTYLDIVHSRSFGIITKNKRIVQEGVRLFEADAKRQSYVAGLETLVVSPVNARKGLTAFIRGARKQLLIYDPKISDTPMIHLLQQRARAGVEVRVIGKMSHNHAEITVRKMANMRLHTRTIIRDRRRAFIGSQSLRAIELDGRREAGLIFHDGKALGGLVKIFEKDWETATSGALSKQQKGLSTGKAAKRVAEMVTQENASLAVLIEGSLKEIVGTGDKVKVNSRKVERNIQEAIRSVVDETLKDAIVEAKSNE
ncbi:MAG TPA: phospholipase D-like domain-containing protein [Terriglobia bacterium]|nr:phospholipase D-like domain-containing protein [Terriglobia bacterium]